MDKQQDLTKKVYIAIYDTLCKEDATIEEGINAMTSAVTRILYGFAFDGTMSEDIKWTQKDFAIAVLNQAIEQLKTMPDNIYFKEEDNGAGKQH